MGSIARPSWNSLLFILVSVAAFLALPHLLADYDLYIANLMQVNILLAVGMNIVVGTARQFSLSSAALFGIGAYVSVLLQLRLEVPFIAAAAIAVAFAALVSALLSMLAWRVGGIYLAMITFGFSEVFQFFLAHADALTNGPDGLTAPKPNIFGHAFFSHADMFRLILPVTVVSLLLCRLLERSATGLRLIALGDSEVALASVGYEPRWAKTVAFAIQGAYAGCAGVLFAAMVGFIDPYSFGMNETIQSLTAIALGGLGSLSGSVVGAIALTLLDRILTEFPGTREFAYGLALLAVFLLFPGGLASFWKK